jgi:hypothetical protein
MMRSTRSLVLTECDIVGARRSCNLIKIKSSYAQIAGIFEFGILESTLGPANVRAIAQVAGAAGFLGECCREMARV